MTKSALLKKEELIQRLLAKASLDFKCCGHGGPPAPKAAVPGTQSRSLAHTLASNQSN